MSSRIIVRGKNVTEAPLLETSDAKAVEFYDVDNNLCALLVSGVLAEGVWAFANKYDEDWAEVLIRFGYADVSASEVARMKQGVGVTGGAGTND